MQFDNLF